MIPNNDPLQSHSKFIQSHSKFIQSHSKFIQSHSKLYNPSHPILQTPNHQEAMKDSYEGISILRNKWMIWKQKPIGGHRTYSFPRNKQRRRIKEFNRLLWHKYRTTSKKSVVLDEYEKLRILDFQLNKMIQMGEMSTLFIKLVKTCL